MPLAYRLQPNNHYMHRLLVMFLTCAPTFVLLTISYEGLFYVAFCVTLVAWVRLEHQILTAGISSRRAGQEAQQSNGSATKSDGKGAPTSKVSPYRALDLSDVRVALFFFVLLQSAFFSTGNVASVSSFSLESVCRLIPIFDPF